MLQVSIIDNCFYHNLEPIILVMNPSSVPNKYFQQFQSHSIILMNLKDVDNYSAIKEKNYTLNVSSVKFRPIPAQTFHFVELDPPLLESTLNGLKNGIWWNIHGKYIIECTLKSNTCEYAHSFFQIIWDFNILSVIFICRESNKDVMLYTFNPYSNHVPNGWTLVQLLQQSNGHPFRIFHRSYEFLGKLNDLFAVNLLL